jgi:hypothetical protein
MSTHARVRFPAGEVELWIVRFEAYGYAMIHQRIIEPTEFSQCRGA